ncbi:MFS transporter [Sphaerisporangium flaviroseum]|uniref:MFS transporter n=1 Tax=Sphaerisporangium flaviroseum TaxID=509199 RepID=A0ABP7J7Z3_9ACTN
MRSGTSIPPLALAGFTVSLVNTLPIPLLGTLPELLDTTQTHAYWTVTATLLVGAMSTPIAGRLGDMYGKRRVLLWCLGSLVAGSVVCGLAGSVSVLIAGRALQGCAAGALPVGLGIMRDRLLAGRRAHGFAAMSAAIGVGGTVGFPLAALMAEHADWHALFWLVAAIGLVNHLLVVFRVPDGGIRHGGRFDWAGAVTLSTGLVCTLLVLSKGQEWGWAGGATMATALVGTVTISWWARLQWQADEPLVNLRLLKDRAMLLATVATLLIGFAMFALALVIPRVLQSSRATGYGVELSMVEAGLVLAAAGLAMMLAAPVSVRVAARWRHRGTLLLGCGVVGAGYALVIPFPGRSDGLVIMGLVTAGVVVGVGLGLAFFAMPAIVAERSPAAEIAAANGLNALIRQLGAALCSALTSAVYANLSIRLPAGDGSQLVFPSRDGLTVALLAACAACALAASATALIPRDTR